MGREERPSLESLRGAARQVYGSDAAGYDAGRPDYPDEVYDVLRDRCGLGPGTVVLESGPGTGMVTRHLLAHGARVVAVEPDPALAAYLRDAVPGDLDILVGTFEEAPLPEGHFDLAVAATSFHWVDQAVGVPKLGRVLRPGGWVALWWTIFDDPDREDPFREATGKLLGTDDPDGQRRRSQFQLDAAGRCDDLRRLGGLVDVDSRRIHWSVRLTSDQVRALYASLIEIRRRPPAEQERVLAGLVDIADHEFGGEVDRPFVTALYRPSARHAAED